MEEKILLSCTKKKGGILLKENKPDFILVLGDRYEILSCGISSIQFNIPIIHIHGGEVTNGSLDNIYRNIITKISHVHFVCHEDYRKRIIQMGENPKLIFNFGAPSLDFKKNDKKFKIEKKIEFFLNKKDTYIVTYHPNTISHKNTKKEVENLLTAIKKFKDLNFIFTYPNLDNSNLEIVKKINDFSNKKKNIMIIKSLGRERYFYLMQRVSGLIGNSSSAILESSTYRLPCLNIGYRQDGRIMTKNIINCNFEKNNIIDGIIKINSIKFRKKIKKLKNPFYKPSTSLNIYKVIKNIKPYKVINKKFFDIER